MDDDSPIGDFFRGKCVFLTGCTGFLGQLYLAKLLGLDVKTIYILMRPKRTKSCADRLDDILREPIFDQVLNKYPNSRDRIRIVNGTLAAPHLELVDGNALNDLIESIEIVIHSAANVSFVADIYDVIATNLYGTQQLLELCKRMPLLEVFLYVSTAFCQLHHGEPIEQFYEPIIDPLLLIDWYHRMKANQSDRTEFEIVAEKLMSDAQMTPYTLSKNATEALIQSYGKWLPLAVVRPSIVVCTRRDPIPAWIHGIQLTNFVGAGIMSGLIRTMHYEHVKLNAIFGDMVINGSLAVIWHTAVVYGQQCGTMQPKVYHLTNQSKRDHVYVDEVLEACKQNGQRYAQSKCLWYPTLTRAKFRWHYRLCQLFYDIIPGAMFDWLVPNKPLSCLKVTRAFTHTPKFNVLTEEHSFRSDEINKVWRSLTDSDKHFFDFDTTTINAKTFIPVVIQSIRERDFKQSAEQLKAIEKQFNYRKLLHLIVKLFSWTTMIACIVWYLLHACDW